MNPSTSPRRLRSATPVALAAALTAALAGCASTATAPAGAAAAVDAPELQARVKPILTAADGTRYKDLNGNGRLDAYEDWRRPVDERVGDLVAQMTLEEKAGLMLIDTLNGGCGGATSARAEGFVRQQQMHRFILRNVVNAVGSCAPDAGIRAGSQLTPQQAAQFTNAVQAMTEATRLGIPALFKSNARNHFERDARTGINNSSGVMTEFPKEAGLAAAALGDEALKSGKTTVGDMAAVKLFAHVMGEEWKAIGLRGMYGYMADLATEPRWYRVHETFTEDADLAANILKTLVERLQGGPLNPASPVALTLKHFPGGGPQELGLDPHYAFGKNQVYPAGNFGWHLKPFKAAIDAGVSSVMPYYGVPIQATYEGVTYEQTGMAFSKQIVTDLLRGKLGFQGYVNSDTGVINDRAWGLEGRTVPERVAAAINGGTDTLSGFNDVKTITDLVRAGLVSEARVTEAAQRLVKPLFQMGLFENPYVDEAAAAGIVGREVYRQTGLDVQRRSIVLLQNQGSAGARTLPLAREARTYTMGLDSADAQQYFARSTNGEVGADGRPLARDAAGNLVGRPSAAGFDRAVIRVEVGNAGTGGYRSKDPATGANPAHRNPLTGKTWGETDPCITHPARNPNCVDDGHLGGPTPLGLVFGGAFPWEANHLSFTAMAASKSWRMSPSLADIQAVMKEIGPEKVVLSINFRQPYVIDEASGLRRAGAIVAGFGVSNTALLDVLTGRERATGAPVKPQGRLPFALANNLQAVIDNQPDAPGYPAQDTLYPFGFGLSY
ncbi:MAG TPA: glycoside hydrolase family 3 N-terminal domain-containing protein [Burkholderiaceae bacterium]|nr:glycoside hydrolase family 3 N-terminal domain-containing protein [Burkholderiaceae bacterium]HNB43317.1 glycoside hydrolase family 3 N-terminal domain-containing protein [Burkholderiaceae bacterium]HNG79732.1 glycoside hydrolase family 3 N-terminal domain-containing protein [Burkholderiaceae bacterium]